MSKYNLKTKSDKEFEKEFREAQILGDAELKGALKATSARFDRDTKRLILDLENGITTMIPTDLIQGLQTDDIAALEDFELTQLGSEIHWETLDAQFYVESLVRGRFGTQRWMSALSEHMSEIGRKGGMSRSTAKRNASADNGKKGGRPRTASNSVQRKRSSKVAV